MNTLTTAPNGVDRRLARVLGDDGRALIVGYDHAVSAGPSGGYLGGLRQLAHASWRGGADGLQMGLHSAKTLDPEVHGSPTTGLVLRVDRSPVTDDPHERLEASAHWAGAEQVVRAGGDCAVVFLIYDVRAPRVVDIGAERTGALARECERLGLPLMVEVMAKAADVDDAALSQIMIDGTRVAFELGADLVKIDRTPSRAALADLVAAVPVPVLLRGGPPRNGPAATIADLEACLDAGMAGAVYGRTVWQDEDPEGITRELRSVIHGR